MTIRSKSLVLALFISTANAELLSEHNEPHAGIQAGIDRLSSDGCTRYTLTRSGQYTLNSSTDATKYTLTGNTITIKCTRYSAPDAPDVTVYQHELTWSPPCCRIDGSALIGAEIRGYMLEVDGIASDIGNVLRYIATYSVDMVHRYRIATIDSNGNQGPWSNEVRL